MSAIDATIIGTTITQSVIKAAMLSMTVGIIGAPANGSPGKLSITRLPFFGKVLHLYAPHCLLVAVPT